MKRILKYELKIEDEQEIEMPEGSDILTVIAKADIGYRNTVKYSHICLWAMVEEAKEKIKYKIRMIGTGHRIENTAKLKYIATICFEDGLVLHCFLEGE